MRKRVAMRILELVITLVTITFFSFLLVYLAPMDAAEKILNGQGFVASQDTVDALRQQLGLDQSLFTQYLSWIGHVLQGDLGTSFRTGTPVVDLLTPALIRTVRLALMAFAITVVVSLPLGMLCARYKDSLFDRIVRYITYLFASFPAFFIGFVVLWIFAGVLKLIPVSIVTAKSWTALIVPAFVLSFNLTAWMTRQVRTVVLEKLSDGFVMGLRSRGIPEGLIYRRYVLKSSLAPIITALGICLGSVMGGAVLVENVFSWPGLGQAVITAINYLDYPVIQGFTIWIALIYFAINVAIDVAIAIVDPRTRAGGTAGKRPRSGGRGDADASGDDAERSDQPALAGGGEGAPCSDSPRFAGSLRNCARHPLSHFRKGRIGNAANRASTPSVPFGEGSA